MNVFQPISPDTSHDDMMAAINNNFARLDGEAVTKVIKQAGGKIAMIEGRLPYGGFGTLYYDKNGIPTELIGQAPDDGRVGHWITKPGIDVIKQLGG